MRTRPHRGRDSTSLHWDWTLGWLGWLAATFATLQTSGTWDGWDQQLALSAGWRRQPPRKHLSSKRSTTAPLLPSFPHKAAISVPPCWLLCSATLACCWTPVRDSASGWQGWTTLGSQTTPSPQPSTPPSAVILQSVCFPASATSMADINRNL